jgi:hypothetical protein
MNKLPDQIASLLKRGRPREIDLQKTHRPEETRALKEIGRAVAVFLKG